MSCAWSSQRRFTHLILGSLTVVALVLALLAVVALVAGERFAQRAYASATL